VTYFKKRCGDEGKTNANFFLSASGTSVITYTMYIVYNCFHGTLKFIEPY